MDVADQERQESPGESVLIPNTCPECKRSMVCGIERQVGSGNMCRESVTCPHCRHEFPSWFPAPLLWVQKR